MVSLREFFQHQLSHRDAGAAGTAVQHRAALHCPPVHSLAKAFNSHCCCFPLLLAAQLADTS